MPWIAIAMCLVEFAERASYYGTSGVFNNFITNPLPIGGNGAGAVAKGALGLDEKAGALGMKSQVATALTTLFTFLAYTIPILGGIVADTKWGRFKTICVGVAVGAIAHVILIIPAIPSVIASGKAIGPFIVGLIILAFAAGFIKPCLSPLLCDQSPVKVQTVTTLKSGERVILDPTTTIQRYLLIFYWAINIGAFFSLATTYAEHDVGFWLAYLLPGIIYMLVPIVLVFAYRRLYKAPPQGSVVKEAGKVIGRLMSRGGWKHMWTANQEWWDRAKPSYIVATEGHVDTKKVFWDDKFVDEIKQTVAACQVFLLIPIFNLSDGGFGSTENAMTDAMKTNGVPNDLINNFNSLTIVVCAPILNYWFYPMMAKFGHPLKPMTRMSIGFMLGCLSMIYGAILQWKVYQTSSCGNYATSVCQDSPLSLWLQIPLIALPALGELFVNVTSYEVAYTRAPARMKSLVMALCLFSSAISSALTEALTEVLVDPYLIWPYVALAVATLLCAIALPTYFKHLNEPVSIALESRTEGNASDAASESYDDKKQSIEA